MSGAPKPFQAVVGTTVWLVTNGRRVAGPVSTGALLRAIGRGLLDADSLVRQPTWAAWRPLSQVREAEAWFGGAASSSSVEEWLDRASDRGEIVHFALVAAQLATGASWGMAHVRRGGSFVTSCVAGDLSVADHLGRVVEPQDPLVQVARAGKVYVGEVRRGDPEPEALTVARRLGDAPELVGVAMVPLLGHRRLLGMVEVGRREHPFRAEDRALLERLAWGVRIRVR